MKNLVLLVLFIFLPTYLFTEQIFFNEFELQRINENYYGIAGNSKNIVIFGDWGGIFRSIDSGKTWKKFTINNDYPVMDIIEAGYLYGVLNQDYIIKSNDKGKTWEKNFIGDFNFHRIKFYKNNLYCLAENKIIVCNYSLEKINAYDIQIGNINGNPGRAVGDQYDFEIFNDKIFYVSDTTEITEIDIETNKTRKINLRNYGNIIKDRVPSNLMRINDKLYFTIWLNLYSFSDDTLLLVQEEKQQSIWTTFNNDIFYLNSVFFRFKNLDSISFNKVIPGSNPHKINNGINDRYISNCRFKALKFLTENIVLAVGISKLIYVSFNKGIKWQLISHMDNRIQSSIFKGSENHAMYVSDDVKFVHTTDNGITWKPQKLYSDYFFSKYIFGDLLNNGCATMFNDIGVTFYSDFFTEKSDTNFFVSEQNGEILRFLNNNAVIGYPPNGGISNVKYSFFENNNKLFLTHNSGIPQFKWLFSFLFVFDDNMYMTRKNFFDSSHVMLMDTFGDGLIYGLTVNYRKANPDGSFKGSLSLIKSTNGGEIFDAVADYGFFNHRISIDSLFIEGVTRSTDEIFFYYKDTTGFRFHIYSININTKELSEIGMIPENFSPGHIGVQKFNSKYYFNCYKFPSPGIIIQKLYINDDPFNNPNNWKEVINPGYTNLRIEVLNDSTSIIAAYDSLINNYVIWFASLKKPTEVEGQTETQKTIYLSDPMPNPSQNNVRVKLYYDMAKNLDNLDIRVYDILGMLVSKEDEFIITNENNHSAYITWQHRTLPSGVYFIRFHLDNQSISKSIVIIK